MEELKFIGIGDAISIELGGNCCCLKNGRQLLLIDACEGAAIKLQRAGCFEGTDEVFIAISHLHFDHIAGLGSVVWQCYYRYKIRVKLLYGDEAYRADLESLMRSTGLKPETASLVKDSEAGIEGLSISFVPTMHEPSLRCHGILLEDERGKYYYSGDTSDIDFIRRLAAAGEIRRIYAEVSRGGYGVHLKYEDLLQIPQREKLRLMHFDTEALKERAAEDGFTPAQSL